MDPIPIRRALILAASGGIGAALMETLTSRGTRVAALSRARDA